MKAMITMTLAAIALGGCGSSPRYCGWCCEQPVSKCSADPPAECRDPTIADGGVERCYGLESAFFNCARSKQWCGADNKTDAARTLEGCKAEFDAWGRCLTVP